MSSIEIHREDSLVILDFSANAFLHNMVRIIVGCLIEVGSGKRAPSWLAEVRDARDRTRAAATAEAAGLYLVCVSYDAVWGLPPTPRALPHGLHRSPAACP
jgi:tRNA pseudouridine38-40 synthase